MTPSMPVSLKRVSVASAFTSAQEIKGYIARLASRKPESRYDCYFLDGSDVTPDNPDAVILINPLKLAPLSAFRVCAKNDQIFQVSLKLRLEGSREVLDALKVFSEQHSTQPITRFLVTAYCDGRQVEKDLGDHWITCGWQRKAEKNHYLFGVDDEVKPRDLQRRTSYFTRAVSEAGLAARIHIISEGGGFSIEVDNKDELWTSGADLKRRNPFLFHYSGLESFQQAWTSFDRVLQCAELVSQVNSLALFMKMPPPVYESMLDGLNELAEDWRIEFYGSYAEGTDPYTADASQSPDGRFPLLLWSPHRGDTYFQADLVAASNGRRLEIHSNCGDLKRLLNEAAPTSGLRFMPVDET